MTIGQILKSDFVKGIVRTGLDLGTQYAKAKIKAGGKKEFDLLLWLKEYWYWPVAAVAALIAYFVFKRK